MTSSFIIRLVQFLMPLLLDFRPQAFALRASKYHYQGGRPDQPFSASDDADAVIYRHYHPPGVKRVIASGSSAFIGEVDESTVLKYLLLLMETWAGSKSRGSFWNWWAHILGLYGCRAPHLWDSTWNLP